MITYPSIQLGAGPARYFNILYDSYGSSDLTDWMDEGSGQVDGSGGGGSIYETTSGPGYLFDENVLYESEEEQEITLGYSAETDEESKYKYLRSILAYIPKNRLKYLPYVESEQDVFVNPEPSSESEGPATNFPGRFNYYENNTVTVEIDDLDDPSVCLSRVIVRGYKGTASTSVTEEDGSTHRAVYFICEPGVRVESKSCDDSSATLLNTEPDRIDEAYAEEYGDSNREQYTLDIKIDLTPTRMITERSVWFKLSLRSPSDQGMSIDSVQFFYATYVDGNENIQVWERRYNVSEGSTGSYNPDATNHLLGDPDLDNSGVYWNEIAGPGGNIRGVNKFRAIGASQRYSDFDDLPTGNLATWGEVAGAELNDQKELWETAREQDALFGGNAFSYKFVYNPTLYNHFSRIRLDGNINVSCSLYSTTRNWEEMPPTIDHEIYPLWYPQGHSYSWQKGVGGVYCYFFPQPNWGPWNLMTQTMYHHHSGHSEEMVHAYFALHYVKKAYYVGKIPVGYATMGGYGQPLGDGADFVAFASYQGGVI
jgi:hypothetical protein